MTSPTIMPANSPLALEIRVLVNAGVPVSGAAGTFAGVAIKGQLLIDSTNANLYQNTGTLLAPTWTPANDLASGTVALPVLAATTSGTVVVNNPVVKATSVIDGLSAVNANGDAAGLVVLWVQSVGAGTFTIGYRNIAGAAMAAAWAANYRVES